MKVLFYNHTGRVSGAERVLLTALESLREGIEACIVCPDGDLARRVEALGLAVTTVPEVEARFTLRPDRLLRYAFNAAATVSRFRKIVRASDAGVVHANSIRGGLVAVFATVFTGRKIVVHVHDELKPHPISTAIRIVFAASSRASIVAVSHATARSFGGRLARWMKLSVIHNAVDTAAIDALEAATGLRKQISASAESFLFGIVGQITPRKGQLHAVEAFAEAALRLPQARLVIVGDAIFNNDHVYRARIEERVRQLDLTGRVHLLGQRSDAVPVIKELDTLLINSTSEAFVMVAIEAMACGTPVIATDVGGTREMIDDLRTGFLVKSGDRQQLLNAMTLAYTQGELRTAIAGRAQELARKSLSIEHFRSEFEHVLLAAGAERSLPVRVVAASASAFENQ